MYKNEKILGEVKDLSSRLLKIAKTQDSHSLLAQTYLLQSKLALLELDVTQAQYLLTQAELTANEKKLRKLAIKISNEYDAIIDRSKWEKLKKRNASIIERVEASKFNEVLADMIRRHKNDQFEPLAIGAAYNRLKDDGFFSTRS